MNKHKILGFVLCSIMSASSLAASGCDYSIKPKRHAQKDSFKKSKKHTRKHSHVQRESIKHLNKLLANEFVMLMQTLNYHWNLVGDQFHDYHLLFDKQYTQLFADLDLIAERVRAAGGQALGSVQDMLKHATLREDTGPLPEPKRMVHNLLGQYEQHIYNIKSSIGKLEKTSDYGSKKMLEDLLEQHEKTAWMLRSLIGQQ